MLRLVVLFALLSAVIGKSLSEWVKSGGGADRRVEVEMVPMRDGVKLHTVIVYPRNYKAGDKKTVIMDRSPYGSTGLELINDIFVPAGFIAVGQDMRGTGQSEGEFTIWHSDANDSQDVGDYLTQQSYSNGKIFTFGASADGLASFQTVQNEPSWLHAQYVIWSSSQGYDIIYPNGAYLLALAEMWIKSTVPDQADECLAVIEQNEMKTDWWTPLELTNRYYKVKYPSGFWAGWYDIFLLGNLNAYHGYNYEADPAFKSQSRITIDPLGHCQAAAEYFPQDLIFGRTALAVAQIFETFGVFGVVRPGIKNVTFYVMSSNDSAGLEVGQYWTSLEQFPTPTMTKYYLHSDQSISSAPPSSSDSPASSSFKHDPNNYIPSMGGNNLAIPCGPLDQRVVDSRADVIVFNSAPFTSPLYLTGPIFATLSVSSDAIDTDFMVRISDVYPTGEVRLLQDNAIRMRWREGGLTPLYMTPGEIYPVTMTIWNTSYVLAEGHQLRVSISSSNYPRFDINRNNGILMANRTANDVNITATNSIYHSSDHPSYISLPVVKKSQIPKVKDIVQQVYKAYPFVDWERVNTVHSKTLMDMVSRFH